MTLKEISLLRLSNQKISATEFNSARDIVSWMGAIQAQDFPMAKWAIGLRLSDSTDKNIEESFNKGEILRTHLMRPTWHFICAEDIYWMLDLTAPHIKTSIKSRNKTLELNDKVLIKSNSIIEEALASGISLTRDELKKKFNEAAIRTDDNRLSHLLVCAELDGLICSGPVKMKKQTYCLLRERVPQKKVLTKEESLYELAKRYYNSHGPATLNDFIWWSGLRIKDAREAFESVKSGFVKEIIGYDEYLFPIASVIPKKIKPLVYLLPAYDEFLISYKDRSASISVNFNKNAISNNGIFYPAILINGQVKGVWKRSINKDKVNIGLALFEQITKDERKLIVKKAEIIALFLNKQLEIEKEN